MASPRTRRGYVPHATQQKWAIEPIEVRCDYCQRPTRPLTGAQMYPHLPHLATKCFYKCEPCKAWVGCHPGTWQPLGRLADAKLRFAKQAAHAAFDPIWQARIGAGLRKREARNEAYGWLADQLGIDRDACHIGMFDVAQCQAVIRACSQQREAA